MGYIRGLDRNQVIMMPKSMDEYIDETNPCRVIDAFVDMLNLKSMGFKHTDYNDIGRPSYDPKDMLKLYMYGYLNKVRSSRRLERETLRNVEVMWLLRGLTPDDKTICNFRTDNHKALKKVYHKFNQLCIELDLFGKKASSLDGSKFKADNSRNSRYTKDGAERQLERLEKQIAEYLNDLERNDNIENGELRLDREAVERALKKMEEQKVELNEILKKIDENNGEPVCTVDEEAALMKLSGGRGFDVGYNVQTAVDDKHGLTTDFNVTNHCNDLNELHDMAERSKEALGVTELDVLADSGYSNGKEIHECELSGVTCYIPKPAPSNQPEDTQYSRENFKYDKENDTYTCPAGNVMSYARTRDRDGNRVYNNRAACMMCPVKDMCTKSKTLREIERSPYEEERDRADNNAKEKPDYYRRRQALSEHPFGVVKRIWGYDQFLCRGIDKVTGETSLAFLAFNLRRAINILGVEKLMEGIKA